MPARLTRFVFALMVLALGFLALSPWPSAGGALTEPPFPATPGTYWIYRGNLRWTQDGSNQVSTAPITWRTEIRRVITHGEKLGIVISGFPFDLAWADDKSEPSDSLLLESAGSFYFIPDSRFHEGVQRLEDPSDSLNNLFSEDDLFLKWPLSQGQKFCDVSGMARTDDQYCWVVRSSKNTMLQGIQGAEKRAHQEFALDFWTNPDDTHFIFVPQVGITKFEYHHHGTVADTDVQLIEFHPTAANPPD